MAAEITQTGGWVTPAHRSYDFALAQHLFGLELRVVYPDWYGARPVALWFNPAQPQLIRYAWDPRNDARMFENGRDGVYAQTLPPWSLELEPAFDEVVEAMARRGWFLDLQRGAFSAAGWQPGRYTARFTQTLSLGCQPGPRYEHAQPGGAIARAALAVLGVELPEVEL